ncbi:TIR domain-containing protein [Methanospirillum lacunae]|uniref:TIR domain-containing protein n=1 Tax=Methanospirillum lacunae TaxID=668570 RepID=A0A2V2NFW4_9EURY|nr:TIR domain-containing protein [Methanospirillum lacunae]PWR74203.1 hypothetical protein DK846_03375 [Methanospirillum lacunae]
MTHNYFEYDFAISYAGEDLKIAEGIKKAIIERYGNYSVFLAADEQDTLVGKDGEIFFEELFKNSKQIIVLFSENYKRKDWTRFELDIINQQNDENRFIPIKLDNVKILGLPSKIIYLPFSGNYIEIASIAIKKLIKYESDNDIYRDSAYQKAKKKIDDSRGTVDKSVQLIKDSRQRTPLDNIDYPKENFEPLYSIIEDKETKYSTIIRRVIRLNIPDGLSKDEVIYNIKYCTTHIFNKDKPEAIAIFVYSDQASNFLGYDDKINVARSHFAFLGDWGKAEEGFAYNMPVSKFEYTYDFEESYFDKKLKIKPSSDDAKEILIDIFEDKIFDLISSTPKIKTRNIYKNIKIKPEEINKILKKLEHKGEIQKCGSRNDWFWEISNKMQNKR